MKFTIGEAFHTMRNAIGRWRKRELPQTKADDCFGGFDQDNIVNQVLGMSEEAGEAARAVLKWRQGIRGYDFESMKAKAADGAIDVIVYALSLLYELEISGEKIGDEIDSVLNRTWLNDPEQGGRDDLPKGGDGAAYGDVDIPSST